MTYTIYVTNTGNVTLTATVTDILPAFVTLPGGIITWTPSSIAPGGFWVHMFVVTVEVGYAGPLINVVQVSTIQGATGVYTEVSEVQSMSPPNAAFTASPLSGTVPLDVQFTDQSAGALMTWDWMFGDGSISGARHPHNEYEITGTYTVSLTVAGPSGVDTETKTDYITVYEGKTWTFILYLDGDNNLYTWLHNALDRLENTILPPNLTVLVLLDDFGSGHTWRYRLQAGSAIESWNMGELNMGDPQTLSDFITWARDTFSSDYYYLSVADHGRGTTGIAWDDANGGDFITVSELGAALQSATVNGLYPIDIVHYDACLMAMLENAYQIKNLAHYLVASENLGWSVFAYEQYAHRIAADTTPEQLAEAVVDEYHDAVIGYPHTVSALDIGQVDAVSDALDVLVDSLQSDIHSYRLYIEYARTVSQKFDSQDYYIINNDDEYLDLYDFAKWIQQNISDGDVKSNAQTLMDTINTCVIAEQHQSGYYKQCAYWDLDDAHGISIYFPPMPGGWGYNDYMSHIFSFTLDGQWDDFLLDYYAAMGLPPVPSINPGMPPVLEKRFAMYLPIFARNTR